MRHMNARLIDGVYTKFFDVSRRIPTWWLEKAYHMISNWNTDGSAELSGHKATQAIVTPTEVILYGNEGFGTFEIFRLQA